ncbi:MAG: pilus assembly protein PilP, partial [Frankia sp.]
MPRGRIPPLPDVQPYDPFTYDAYKLVDPFKPRKIEPPKNAGGGGNQ